MRIYATELDLQDFTCEAPPANALALLRRASLVVDGLIVTANYATDDDGYPTDLDVSDVLRDATCAQASWFDETGDVSGASSRFNSLGLGNFSASGGGTGSGTNTTAAASRIAPETVQILQTAGLLNQPPRAW